jgi:APA family basic amino acid/polyamine antiporter
MQGEDVLGRVPAASVVLNTFLLGSVSAAAWARFTVWVAATLVVFLLYGLPASYAHHTSRFTHASRVVCT